MHEELRITLVQTDIFWENVEANLASLEEMIWGIGEQTDMILLPEVFNSGFTMNINGVAEHPNGKTMKWMRQIADQTGASVLGSFIVREHSQFFNRLFVVMPGGNFLSYDKRHLFRMAGEHGHFAAGKESLIWEYKGWRIMPLICYDLRFPVYARNIVHPDGSLNYDMQIYLANWPEARINAWDMLLPARAIENQAYVVGVNRIGTDGNSIAYNGHSNGYDVRGDKMMDISSQSFIKTLIFNYSSLTTYRKKFPVHLDADKFKIIE